MSANEEESDPDELEDDEEDDVVAEGADAETSLDEIAAKGADVGDSDDDDSVLTMTREERLESLSIRAAPKQSNEFVCASCHLVKHQSQLADKKRGFCRDCV